MVFDIPWHKKMCSHDVPRKKRRTAVVNMPRLTKAKWFRFV